MSEFNLNNFVKVKLTPKGQIILHNQYLESVAKFHNDTAYSPPKEDADGYSEWQLWELMNRFGEHVYNGCNPPFETTIILIDK